MGVLRSVQVLRGIAALAVVVCHAATTSEKHGITVPWMTGRNLGEWGVDIFFVISGFIMTLITAKHRGRISDTCQFWIRRIFRIAPMYWLVSAAVLANAVFRPSGTDYKPTLGHVIASFLFIPWADTRGVVAPVLRVGWTLNFEMYFYLVFGVLLLAPRPTRWLTAWTFCAVLIGAISHPSNPLGQMLTSSLLLEFLMGIYVGMGFLKGLKLPPRVAAPLAVVAFVAIIAFDASGFRSIRAAEFGIPAALLVTAAVSLETTKTISFKAAGPFLLGEWSYSIYLTHVLTLAACGTLVGASHLAKLLPGTIIFLGEIVVTLGVGMLAYLFFERPIHRFLNREPESALSRIAHT